MDAIKLLLIVGCMVFTVGYGIWYEWNLWSECLGTNSFFYCLRVLT